MTARARLAPTGAALLRRAIAAAGLSPDAIEDRARFGALTGHTERSVRNTLAGRHPLPAARRAWCLRWLALPDATRRAIVRALAA